MGAVRCSYTHSVDLDEADVLAELRRPDELTLRFNPCGLGGRLAPEDSARLQAASIAQALLADDVPADVRDNFERARKLHLYGVLEYSFFTAAADYALLVLEGALRLRFLSHYSGGIPVVRKDIDENLPAGTFDDVRAARRQYRLRGSDGATYPLPLGASALLEWARRERLLTGTRTRFVDRALAALRDHAAHPVTHTVGMPPESARRIVDVAEVINKLWGHDTPGGRLFPSPMERQLRVVALAPDCSEASEMRLDQVRATDNVRRDWLYAVFLAVDGENLIEIGKDGFYFTHRPGFQTTDFPCEQRWQGSWRDLVDAIDAGTFSLSADTVQHLDRLVFIRTSGDSIDHARAPADLLELDEPPEGRWYAVIADSPLDAWAHVRDHEQPETEQTTVCPECFVRLEGTFDTATDAVALALRSLNVS